MRMHFSYVHVSARLFIESLEHSEKQILFKVEHYSSVKNETLKNPSGAFPFDEQWCSFGFSSGIATVDEILIQTTNDTGNMKVL